MTMLVLFFFVINFEETIENHWEKNECRMTDRRTRDNYIFLTSGNTKKKMVRDLRIKETESRKMRLYFLYLSFIYLLNKLFRNN